MNNQTRQGFAGGTKKIKRHGQNGAALVIALLLLLLLTGMTVAMVLSTSSDMLINGYYRNFRGSFYAADSGLAIARQDMVNGILAAVPASFSTSVQPIPAGTEASVVSYINITYGANYQTLNQGQAAGSWPAKYKIDTTKTSLVLSSCSVVGGDGTCGAPTGAVTGYQYIYNYSLTGLGQSRGTEAATVDDSGSFTLNGSACSFRWHANQLRRMGHIHRSIYNLLFAIRARNVDWACFHERCVDLFGCRTLHFHRLRGQRFRHGGVRFRKGSLRPESCRFGYI